MKLYNVTSKLEKELEAIDLTKLSPDELISLAVDIQTKFMIGDLESEIIATDSSVQIAQELRKRVK